MTTRDELRARAEVLLERMREAGLTLASAESCTGGLIMATLTDVPGSSDVVDRGFVTYSNEAKAEMLGVDPALILRHGAVSAEVAVAMARGAMSRAKTDCALAVTGIAGPGGGSAAKPVGLVHVAAVRKGRDATHRECRFGDIGRVRVREETVAATFDLLDALLSS